VGTIFASRLKELTLHTMLKKLILPFIVLSLSFATNLVAQNSDCTDLLVLEDTIYHSNAISGFGTTKEFDGNNLEENKLFEEEENSIWYLITAPEAGDFTFDIVAENESDDWDFLLYRNEKMFCKKLADKVAEPIRSNLSRSPITGISLSSKESFVSAGINNNYSKAVKVKEGDEFILVVNNPKRASGKHTLILHLPKKKEVEVKQQKNTTLFKIEFKDAKTKLPVLGLASISGLKTQIVALNGVVVYEALVSKKNRKLNVEAYAKGYMLMSKEYKVGKTKSNYLAEILLENIELDKRVNLTRIQFYGDQFNLLPSAQPSLKSLLLFMESNPTVTIEIGGHVNGPGERNSKRYKELSYNRAYAVKDYLVKNGIAKERIYFKGYGNSEMLYPIPKSSYQESANRRVEIKILSK